MGQAIFTCHFIFFGESLFSPIWMRLPLANHVFTKSTRKILARNRAAFRTVVRPGQIDEEKEQLFQVYRAHFKGNLAPTLVSSLLDDRDTNVFSTLEVAVYEGDRLVAFSFFDEGDDSLASIKGVYDPDYADHSLGLYTMLEEIAHGMETGKRFFYPGYIVPGYPRFDYKLRMGSLEKQQFFDLKLREWRPYCEFTNDCIPVRLLTSKLTAAAQALAEVGISCQALYYPAYEASFFGMANERFLESPLFLNLYNNIFPRPRFIVYYDIWKESYCMTHCMPLEDLGFYFHYAIQFDGPSAKHYLDFLLQKSSIIETKRLDRLSFMAQQIGKLIKTPVQDRFLK